MDLVNSIKFNRKLIIGKKCKKRLRVARLQKAHISEIKFLEQFWNNFSAGIGSNGTNKITSKTSLGQDVDILSKK